MQTADLARVAHAYIRGGMTKKAAVQRVGISIDGYDKQVRLLDLPTVNQLARDRRSARFAARRQRTASPASPPLGDLLPKAMKRRLGPGSPDSKNSSPANLSSLCGVSA